MSTFFIADLHLGHKNILKYEPETRPFDSIEAHDAELIRRWNAKVGDQDKVYVLGDFAWSEDAAVKALRWLNGRVRMVLGDHDPKWFSMSRIGVDEVEQVHGAMQWSKKTVLTHIPVLGGDGKYERCIHGHLHGKLVLSDGSIGRSMPAGTMDTNVGGIPAWRDAELKDEHDNYCCVSADWTGLAPISWQEIKERKGW